MINSIIKTYINKVKHNFKENISYKLFSSNFDFNKFAVSTLIQELEENAIIILHNNVELDNYYNHFKFFTPEISVYKFPSFNVDIYQKISPNRSILADRISCLTNILIDKNKKIVLTTIDSFLQKIVPCEMLLNRSITLKKNDTKSMAEILDFLVQSNYNRVSLVQEEGEFSVRGDIIDVFIPNQGAFRIDLFGDAIEKIRLFDNYSQRTINEVDSVTLMPSSEILLNQKNLENFIYQYKLLFNDNNAELFEYLSQGIYPKGIEQYVSLFYEKTATIQDYLTANIFLPHDFKIKLEQLFNNYIQEYQYRINPDNIFITKNNILSPEKIFVLDAENLIANKRNFTFSPFNVDEADVSFDVNSAIMQIKNNLKKSEISLDDIVSFIQDNPNNNFVFSVFSENFKNFLIHKLEEKKIIFTNDYYSEIRVCILEAEDILFEEGFVFAGIYLITESEITGIKKTFQSKKSSKKASKLLASLLAGDVVVHINHGMGIYQGIKTIATNGFDHDYLELLYANDEKLYLPVENIELLSKYSSNSEEVSLDKLGSNTFAKRKDKLKEKIKDIAYDLIKISAARTLKKSPNFAIDANLYDSFCKEFPYVETEDQLNAIRDIQNDFLKGCPADRLVCGDVGFGKTEVAMRAAFMMVSSGYQVAIIAPTTLLCNQHVNNFKKRFVNYPFIIEELSRFVSPTRKKQIKADLAAHKIDIIIGTHALLSKDLKIAKLGLIIIDEEQNFGVSHKETLKTIAQDAHIITLTATPIPRTMQLAFKGIKDLSLISTPPVAKLPINTYILPFDYLAIKNAIENELKRDGQIYLVVPRISYIKELELTLSKLQLDVNYVVIHGQMQSKDMESRMIDFQNKKYQILISTNIIESGLDLKNVNTILVYKSDKFGLAQLYQLRGRVGRSSIQSYAYLFYDADFPLNKKAEKRLQILQSLDYLGASFSLANYDLELRGSGNLLGEEQSGHIKEIGFDLYQKLLEKEISFIKENSRGLEEDYQDFSPTISLGIPVLIPKNYIADVENSMDFYQRIGNVKNSGEIEDIKDEMIDRFGKLPYQVENLFLSIKMKLSLQKALIDKAIFSKKGVLLSFYNGVFPYVDKLIAYIESKKGLISIRPDGCILLNLIAETRIQIDETFIILREISLLLKE